MYFAGRFNLASSIPKFNYASDMLGVTRRRKKLKYSNDSILEACLDCPTGCELLVHLSPCLPNISVDSFRPNLFHLQTFFMSLLRPAEKSAGSKSCRFIFRCKNRKDSSDVFFLEKNGHVWEIDS